MKLDLKNRLFGAGHRIYTLIGFVAGVAVAAGQYLDMIPPEYRTNKWYTIAAGVVAAGAWWKRREDAPAPDTGVPPALVLLVGGLLFASPAFGQTDLPPPAPTPATQMVIGSVRGAPLLLTFGMGFSGYGYDFGTKKIAKDATFTGLAEVSTPSFPLAVLGGAGFQAGENQGLALQIGPEFKPLSAAVLFSAVVLGSTRSYGMCAGYVLRF